MLRPQLTPESGNGIYAIAYSLTKPMQSALHSLHGRRIIGPHPERTSQPACGRRIIGPRADMNPEITQHFGFALRISVRLGARVAQNSTEKEYGPDKKASNVSARAKREIREQVERVLDRLGILTSKAVRKVLRQIALQ